jgi:hypothetical protein
MIRQLTSQAGVVVGLLLLASAVCPWAGAQVQRREPTPNETLVSPEVLPDRRVTFRIYAPKASAITVGGDWAGTSGPAKLEKDDKGVRLEPVSPFLSSHCDSCVLAECSPFMAQSGVNGRRSGTSIG